MIKLG
jgi:predicted RNase H-like nuclease (RuvC/YqgF family)